MHIKRYTTNFGKMINLELQNTYDSYWTLHCLCSKSVHHVQCEMEHGYNTISVLGAHLNEPTVASPSSPCHLNWFLMVFWPSLTWLDSKWPFNWFMMVCDSAERKYGAPGGSRTRPIFQIDAPTNQMFTDVPVVDVEIELDTTEGRMYPVSVSRAGSGETEWERKYQGWDQGGVAYLLTWENAVFVTQKIVFGGVCVCVLVGMYARKCEFVFMGEISAMRDATEPHLFFQQ